MTAEGPTLASTWHVIRRRWPFVLIPLLLVPAAAVGFSLMQTPTYRATAEVLLQRQNLASALTGTPDTSLPVDDKRYAETQARLATVQEVARRTLVAANLDDRTTTQYLKHVFVASGGNSDILDISVEDVDPLLASRLATLHAQQFVVYRGELETAAIKKARTEVGERLGQLEQQGRADAPLYRSLQDKEELLATLETLQTARATLVQSAQAADQVTPRPVRNGAVGLMIGVLLGICAALVIEALDTRIRNADEVANDLGAPLLAWLPPPPRRVEKSGQLIMIADPTGREAEAFRVLRTNLELVSLEAQIKTLMVTSALEGEGKTTSATNLAVALARAGRKVILVDLDLRRPSLDRLFRIGPTPGITGIALGEASLDEALLMIDVAGNVADPRLGFGHFDHGGELHVLPAGTLPPNPGEFVGSRMVRVLLEDLEERADIVIVDTPPLLHVGDAMTLTSLVGGVLVVSRLARLRRGTLRELRRLTDRMPAPLLGLVITGARVDSSGYASGAEYGYDTVGTHPIRTTTPSRMLSEARVHELSGSQDG